IAVTPACSTRSMACITPAYTVARSPATIALGLVDDAAISLIRATAAGSLVNRSPLTYRSPFCLIVTFSVAWTSPPDAALGLSISTPRAMISLAVTMNTTSSTSTTSTNGVTLMSVIAPDPSSSWYRLLPAIAGLLVGDRAAAALGAVDQRQHGVRDLVGTTHDHADLAAEEVERDHRGDRDQQADRGRAQRLGEVPQRLLLGVGRLGREVLERVDHAEHGAEQPDERHVVAERAEHDQVAIRGAAPARALAVHRLGDRLGALVADREPAQPDLDRDRRVVHVLGL